MRKKMYLYKALIAVVALTVALVFAGCGKKKNPVNIRVLLDWTPNTNHTGFYVAQEKGWFAKEGITVEMTQPPRRELLNLVGTGNAEFCVDNQERIGPVVAKEHDALPVIAVAAIISHNTSGIMSLAKHNIKSPRDLAGKRYESWENPLVTALIKEIVENDGGKFEDVIMVPHHSPDPVSALQTYMDAIWVYYAWEGIDAERQGLDVNYIDLGKLAVYFDFYTPILAANTNWLKENPKTAKKFMKAVSKGYNFAIENPIEAGEILLKNAPELDRELVMRSQQYLASRYRQDAPRWGEIDPKRWSAFFRWMFENDLLEKDIGSDGFTNEYLPK